MTAYIKCKIDDYHGAVSISDEPFSLSVLNMDTHRHNDTQALHQRDKESELVSRHILIWFSVISQKIFIISLFHYLLNSQIWKIIKQTTRQLASQMKKENNLQKL